MKELFLSSIEGENEVVEFYPVDLPIFCFGCKNCFLKGAEKCLHYLAMQPIWQAILDADLLVFAYPVYALRAPASIKSLLDHLCVRWMVHRPEPEIFKKTAVIITNSVGAPNGSAQKDVITSLRWMGVSNVYAQGAGMMGDIFIDKMTDKHREMLSRRMKKLAKKVSGIKPRGAMSMKVSMLFSLCKLQHRMVFKSETEPSLDNMHYIEHGWIKPRK
jgi:multimeric flavodoxin WrbA